MSGKVMKKSILRFVSFILAAVLLTVCLAGCGEKEENTNKEEVTEMNGEFKVTNKVKITMDDGGEIVIALYGEEAPITVANFLDLVNSGFYNGLIFHRVVPGFVIQGGDPEGTGYGGSEKTIKGEFAENGVDNRISHKRGILSMARSNNPDSASSQFFICLGDVSASLDGKYAAFGEVTEGMDVVDRIASVSCDYNDKPVTDVVMEKVEVID